MSQIVRKQLLSIIDTMESAHNMLPQLLLNHNLDDAIDLLTECQNCAIEMGNKIEKIYGERPNTIHTLEIYCEYVYQLAENITNPDSIADKYRQLCSQIPIIRKSFEEEIPNKKEIVFFPYKASMWDSLESVYLAAKEDPECDAFCVPIPYFEKNPDKSFGQMHYEINEYPSNIEVINYTDYDFIERRPDAVYIHNPYDEWNFVTSVHPDYYCKNLVKYTDKLIYIPYFVLNEIDPSNQNAIERMKHFCFLPGTIYSHNIIVQSENMKQIYVNEFIKAAAEKGLSGQYIDREIQNQRFLGLGSPKLDKVTSTVEKDFSIPKDWLSLITKPDGTYKKIIFYNTTIVAFLKHRNRMLKKIKDTLETFKKETDYVTLLWRPHPLMESTIRSIHPTLLEEYLNIVKEYKQGNWGIYDDSSDLNRAISLSDGYYGDRSSVARLYKETGKPIMIQNIDIRYHSDSDT